MRFDRESYRKLYVAESAEHQLMALSSRGVRDYLLRFASDDGTLLPDTRNPVADLMVVLRARANEKKLVEKAVVDLKQVGFLQLDGCRLWIPRFAEAQVARTPGAKRQAAFRDAHSDTPKEGKPDFGSIRRLRILDGDLCSYCQTTLDFRVGRTPNQASLDHVHPRSRGGSDGEDNLVLACRSCNSKKSTKTPEEAGMALRNPRVKALRGSVTSNADSNAQIAELADETRPITPKPPGGGGGDFEIPCPADLSLLDSQINTLKTGMLIPDEAISWLTKRFIGNNQADPSDKRTLTVWRKCLSTAVSGGWNDQRIQAQFVAAKQAHDDTGGYGTADSWEN